MNRDGPLLEAFNNFPDGVIRQELTSYFMRDDNLSNKQLREFMVATAIITIAQLVCP